MLNTDSQITVAIKPEQYQSVLHSSAFKPGSILKIKVLELSGDRALIDLGPIRTRADIRIPVRRGEELLVKVQESGNQLKLGLLRPSASSLSGNGATAQPPPSAAIETDRIIQASLKPLLVQLMQPHNAKPIPKSMFNVFDMLNRYFESFDLEKRLPEILPRLKSYVNHSGFFFEKQLETAISKHIDASDAAPSKHLGQHADIQALLRRDLKANLYGLKNFAEDDTAVRKALDAGSLVTLRKSIDFLMNDITGQQSRAVRQSDSAEPFQLFSFSLPLAGDNQSARLKIYYPKKQNDGSRPGFQISLLLCMDLLGEFRTDFYLLDQDLSVTFFVKNQSTRARIQQYQMDLQQLLSPLFNQTILRVVVSEKKVNDFEQEDVQISGDRRVDLRI